MKLTATIIPCKLSDNNKSVTLLVRKEGEKYALLERTIQDDETIANANAKLLEESLGCTAESAISIGLIDGVERNPEEREIASVSLVTYTEDSELKLKEDIVELPVKDITGTTWIKDHEMILKATLINLAKNGTNK